MSSEYLLILMLLITIVIVIFIYIDIEMKKKNKIKKNRGSKNINSNKNIIVNNNANHKDDSMCTKSTCDSIDPVSNPVYNMHQIVKQSILLEEHLANKSKRCRDCITKHFSHIIGLAEEAVMLACENAKNYPYMLELPDFYNNLFKKWLEIDSTCLEICSELRNIRKKLISVYFYGDKYKI
jgi:hypothetical protein